MAAHRTCPTRPQRRELGAEGCYGDAVGDPADEHGSAEERALAHGGLAVGAGTALELSREGPEGLARRQSEANAQALEHAGRLQAAARLFEYVGEHEQAAALRLEHASTLGQPAERIAILREGAARIGGSTAQGRELHLALARALCDTARILDPGPERRALILEAAQSFETSEHGAEAGRIYEELRMLGRAERAYRDAGALEDYERVLSQIEAKQQARLELQGLRESIDEALADGRRRQARRLLRDYLADQHARGTPPEAALARELGELEQRSARSHRWELAVSGPDGISRVRVITGPRLRIGRAPECELRVEGAAVSRHHVDLILGTHPDEPEAMAIVAIDRDSRAGTFFDSAAIAPELPAALDYAAELAIGIAQTWNWYPSAPSHSPWGLLGPIGDNPRLGPAWLLFAPDGAPLATRPGAELPAFVRSEGDLTSLHADPDTLLTLNGRPVGSGARIELLRNDRLRLERAGSVWELEVRAR